MGTDGTSEEDARMNKTEFIFELVRAGYSKEQCGEIEYVIECASDRIPQPVPYIRGAAHQYMVACTDISKLGGFLFLVDEMNRKYASSWDNSVQFVLKVVLLR